MGKRETRKARLFGARAPLATTRAVALLAKGLAKVLVRQGAGQGPGWDPGAAAHILKMLISRKGLEGDDPMLGVLLRPKTPRSL